MGAHATSPERSTVVATPSGGDERGGADAEPDGAGAAADADADAAAADDDAAALDDAGGAVDEAFGAATSGFLSQSTSASDDRAATESKRGRTIVAQGKSARAKRGRNSASLARLARCGSGPASPRSRRPHLGRHFGDDAAMRICPYVALALAAASCGNPSPSPAPTPAATTKPPVASASASAPAAPAPPLPPGVLAQIETGRVTLTVQDHEGWRYLLMNGVPQGGRRLEASAAVPADPLVELALGARPNAKTALVLGLGTGKTATDLAARGVKVLAVEVEPGVVELARKWFDFRGEVVVDDAAHYLETHSDRYDIVVVDAETNFAKNEKLLSGPAAAKSHLHADGLLVGRATHTPKEGAEAAALLGPAALAFGNGTGEERQTVYMLSAAAPLEIVAPAGVTAFPLGTTRNEPHPAKDVFERTSSFAPDDTHRFVELVGYLVRLKESDAIAVEVPHAEMGAVRFVVRDKAHVDRLSKLLPAGTAFPTAGDVSSDGDRKDTLVDALGGGGVKRSDVRASPVAVGILGRARLRAMVDPNAVFAGKALSEAGPTAAPAREPLLPFGGALYDLEVQNAWVLERPTWKRWVAKAATRWAAIAAEAKKGGLVKAANELHGIGENVYSELGPPARRLPAIVDLLRTSDRMAEEGPRFSARGATPLQRGAACDRARGARTRGDGAPSPIHAPVLDALLECAVREYSATFATTSATPEARAAIGRLKWLHAGEGGRRADALEKRFPDVPPLSQPP